MVLRKFIKKVFPIRESRPIVEIDGKETNIVEMSSMMKLRRMIFRFLGMSKNDPVMTYFRSASDVKCYLAGDRRAKNPRGIKNFLWFPQYYGIGGETSKRCVKSIHNLIVDVDSKVCSTKEEFKVLTSKLLGKENDEVWNSLGLPKPTFVVCSGSGIHLYWTLKNPIYIYKNKKMLGVAETVHREIINRLEKHYNGVLDKISILQGFRVPGSLSKTGKTVLAFRLNGGFYDSFENLVAAMAMDIEGSVNSDEKPKKQNTVETPPVDGISSDKCGDDSLRCEEARDSSVVSCVSQVENRKVSTGRVRKHRMKHGYKNWKYVPITRSELSVMDRKTYLSGIYKALDANLSERSRFVGKVISLVVFDGKIPVGYRNMRLFGVAVSLAKAKASEMFMMDIIQSINGFMCESPLSIEELKRMVKSAKKYLKMTWEKLKSYIFYGKRRIEVTFNDFEGVPA